MITVTKTFLPPLENYTEELAQLWETRNLTNRGPYVCALEGKLKNYLGVEHVLLLNNGTIPIQIAIELLGGKGEIITTPFSYVATSAAIVWQSCTPVFVDIDSEYLTINEYSIVAAITAKTRAILATHVFGNPCNVIEIERIAKKYGLYVIYDAAHAFGVKFQNESIFKFGDVSTCSFHATKLFHTGEGGAIFSNNQIFTEALFRAHNFGHINSTEFDGVGINGKMSELHAILGHVVLPHIDDLVSCRKHLIENYCNYLDWSRVSTMKIRDNVEWNYSYFPILFENTYFLEKTISELNKNGIFPRRYFFPSLNQINYLSGVKMPISENISSRILCLPLYHDLDVEIVERISNIVNRNSR